MQYKSVLLATLVAFGLGYYTRASSFDFSLLKPNSNKQDEIIGIETKVDIIAERLVSLEEELRAEESSAKKQAPKKIKDSEALKNTVWDAGDSHVDDPFFGPSESEVVVMAFVDYLSESSRSFFVDTFKNIRSNYIDPRKIKFIVRDFTVVDEIRSLAAAKASHCAGEQGLYKEMSQHLMLLMDKSRDVTGYGREMAGLDNSSFDSCLASRRYNSEAKFDREEGEKLGAVGTPSFFIGRKQQGNSYQGYLLRGAQPYKVFANLLERLVN